MYKIKIKNIFQKSVLKSVVGNLGQQYQEAEYVNQVLAALKETWDKMNFLNDSLKTLKNVLADGLDPKFENTDEALASSSGQQDSFNAENGNLIKIINTQLEEVRYENFHNLLRI